METLQTIWTDLGKPLRKFVGSRVSDSHTADDITQDVMLKIAAHLDSMPAGEKLPAWLFRIARNTIVDHYRASGMREHVALDSVDAPAAEFEPDPELVGELSSCLTRMIERLDQPYRDALKQADLDGLSQQELADRAGISLSGAKSRVQRARQQLREMFRECCAVEQDRRGRIVNYHATDRACDKCNDADASDECD